MLQPEALSPKILPCLQYPQDTFYFSYDTYHFPFGLSKFCDVHTSPLPLDYNLFEDSANSLSALLPASRTKQFSPHICWAANWIHWPSKEMEVWEDQCGHMELLLDAIRSEAELEAGIEC